MDDYAASVPAAPPCLTKSRTIRNLCEYSKPCRTIGRCGTSWGDERRKTLFLVATVVAVTSAIFKATALAGVTYDTSILRNVYWAKGKGQMDIGNGNATGEIEIFIGLNMQVVDAVINEEFFHNAAAWSDVECIDPHCDGCKSSATAMVLGAVMAFATSFPGLLLDIKRGRSEWDLNCQKTMGQFMANGVSLVSTTLSLSAFSQGCYRNMPDSISACNQDTDACVTTTSVEWSLGPGCILLITATCLKFIDLTIHVLVPTPARCHKAPTEAQELPQQEMMPAAEHGAGKSPRDDPV